MKAVLAIGKIEAVFAAVLRGRLKCTPGKWMPGKITRRMPELERVAERKSIFSSVSGEDFQGHRGNNTA